MKIQYSIKRSYSFDASHILPYHDGKCANLHGHTYLIEVEISASKLQDQGAQAGMLLDFAVVDAIIKPIIERLDHNHINIILENPTAELIAQYLANILFDRLMLESPFFAECWQKIRVLVAETPRAAAIYEMHREEEPCDEADTPQRAELTD